MGRGNSKVGRGGGALTGAEAYGEASAEYTVPYESYARGQISRTDAGQLYKAVKNGDVEAKPELARDLYDQSEENIKFASVRYAQNSQYYDRVERLTHSLLNKDYTTAQRLINDIQTDNIERAGKKSRWYKYKKGR